MNFKSTTQALSLLAIALLAQSPAQAQDKNLAATQQIRLNYSCQFHGSEIGSNEAIAGSLILRNIRGVLIEPVGAQLPATERGTNLEVHLRAKQYRQDIVLESLFLAAYNSRTFDQAVISQSSVAPEGTKLTLDSPTGGVLVQSIGTTSLSCNLTVEAA